MLFSRDTEEALTSATELVNSAPDDDVVGDVTGLAAFYRRHGFTGRFDGDDAELDRVRALRPRLRTLLTSSRDDAAALVSALLAEHRATPRLVRHDGSDWHVHAVGDDEPFDVRVAVETAMAMIDLIRADELSRLGRCAGERCDGIVLDLSRNRSRKFCSTRCANRSAVAAYRARGR